jgi:outer membrane protein OmpA-like peptidoglycan-associated protein
MNVMDFLKGSISPDLIGQISSKTGESESSVSRGLDAALPLIMGALLQKTNDSSAMSQIMSVLTNRANTSDVIENPRALLTGDRSSSVMTDLGGSLLSTLFGSQLGSAVTALGEHAGLKRSSASTIMTLGASLITALLGDKVRREGLSSTGLISLLTGQRDSILRSVPGALASLSGLGTLRNWGESAAATTARTVERRPSAGLGWLPWAAIATVGLLALAWALLRNTRAPEIPTRDVSAPVADARRADQRLREAADAPARPVLPNQPGQVAPQQQLAYANLGSFVTRKLPSNVELGIPERGVESQVIAYLDDPSKQLEPAVWFNFDRVLFETGSATLRPESREQLKNVAEIMKAYPNVKLKIGGYTDNTGDPTANVKLSQDRANAVMAAIVAQGISADRLSAEGFGDQYPVADNSTDAGRQQNRRIAMRVTEK